MEHEIGCGSTATGRQERSAEGVMVRRPSVASLDSGAESPVYGAESSAAVGRISPGGKPSRAGGGRWPAWAGNAVSTGNNLGTVNGDPTELGAPRFWSNGGRVVSAEPFGGITALQVPQGGSARDITVTVSEIPGEAGARVSRLAPTYDLVVVDPQCGRWYVKDIRASTQPMGTQ
jgi:hypothetical protein